MDNTRLVRIAARVAAASVQLQGPFNTGAPAPEHMVDVDLPFGLEGEIVKLLMQSWGEDTDNLNRVKELAKGPVPDVSVGYSIKKAEYRKGQVGPSWYSPGDDDEFELEIEITHLGGIGLSDVDKRTLDKAGLTQAVHDAVYEKHALEYSKSDDYSD